MNTVNKTLKTFVYAKRIFVVGLIYIMHTFFYSFFGSNHVDANFNLLTDLDYLFPFVPEMVYIYMSYYAIIVVSVFFLDTEESFRKIIISILGTLFLTYPFFYFLPAYYNFPELAITGNTTKLLDWCYSVDVPNNTFPSLHVGLSFTMAFGIRHYKKKLGLAYIFWAVAIALSTIMIRKHFFIDTLGGIVMATLSYSIFVKGKLFKHIFRKFEQANILLANKLEQKEYSIRFINKNIFYAIIMLLKMK